MDYGTRPRAGYSAAMESLPADAVAGGAALDAELPAGAAMDHPLFPLVWP